MYTFHTLKWHFRRGMPARLVMVLLLFAVTFFGFGQPIEAGVGLPGQPAELPFGNHDGGQGIVGRPACDASGWATDPDDPARDLQVRILSDGDQVVTVTAGEYRGDLVEVCQEGTCAFDVSLWGLISPGEAHFITAEALDEESASWITLPGSPKTLTCWGYPEGNHDGSQGTVFEPACYAAGWVMDPDDDARDLQVRILSDGNPVAQLTASDFRADLVDICDGGTCGFFISLWGLIALGEQHEIMPQAYDEETAAWVGVDENPILLTCQDWLRIWAPLVARSAPGGVR